MKVSYLWLQDYFDEKLPSPEKIGEALTMHVFEVESIEEKGNDTIFDIKVLPDRSHDCLSHRGIAQEIGVLANLKIKEENTKEKILNIPESNVLKIEVEDDKLCRRFSALVINNVEVKESPDWLRERLESIGQRSINNIVDATNYVMFSLGQPLHAYDRDLLKNADGGWKITVRKAKEGESLLALDDKHYPLSGDELVIVDGVNDSVLGIAGLKGGKISEIGNKTKNIILEAANFEPVAVRKTSKKLGLRTDASVRFENEITPELTTEALKKVSDMILEIAGGSNTQVEGLIDFYPRKPAPYKVGVSVSEIMSTLGIVLSQDDVVDILSRRGFEWEYVEPIEKILSLASTTVGAIYKKGSSIVYDAPASFDCSSYTSYLYSQAGIAIPRMSVDQYVFGGDVSIHSLIPGDLVFSNSNSGKIHFESIEWLPGTEVSVGVDHVGLYVGGGLVIHANRGSGTVSEEELTKSQSFRNIVGAKRIPTTEKRFVVTIPAERIDLRIKEDLIEDIGRIYGYQNIVPKPVVVSDVSPQSKVQYYERVMIDFFIKKGFSQVFNYAFWSEGDIELENPLAQDKKFLRKDLSFGLSNALTFNVRNKDPLGLSQVKLLEIGSVFPSSGEHTSLAFTLESIKGFESFDDIKKKLDGLLGVDIVFEKKGEVFETNLSSIISKLPEVNKNTISEDLSDKRFKTYSQYPFILRDIAVFVPEGEDGKGIVDVVSDEAGELLVNHHLFDVFTKDFPGGKKTSYAYRLVFQSYEKTLTDDEINKIMDRVTGKLNSKDGWEVR